MNEQLDDMYREIILDHYRSPRGRKPLEKADIKSDGSNPACGDEIEMQVEMDNDTIKDIHVNCKGCAISVASGSMLAEITKGKPIDEVRRIAELVRRMLKGEQVEIPDDLGDIDSLRGVQQFPVRIKCALLAWATLVEGLKSYEDGHKNASASTEHDDDEHAE
ncbi:MAG: SUF system NifU family Fe-S cluster assembly protein [candidate division Zixibacteria bacterium]|nr:SUF system NifU family Fe-S cluster assembly protein [candidate division Zixibacteria bacterium]